MHKILLPALHIGQNSEPYGSNQENSSGRLFGCGLKKMIQDSLRLPRRPGLPGLPAMTPNLRHYGPIPTLWSGWAWQSESSLCRMSPIIFAI